MSDVSIHAALDAVTRANECLRRAVLKQNERLYILVTAVVGLAQEQRLVQNYAVSDALRSALNAAGIRIVQGTAGYTYDKIPAALRSHQVNDTWDMA